MSHTCYEIEKYDLKFNVAASEEVTSHNNTENFIPSQNPPTHTYSLSDTHERLLFVSIFNDVKS